MPTRERLVSFQIKGTYQQKIPFKFNEQVTVTPGAPLVFDQYRGSVGLFQGSQGDYSTVNFQVGTQRVDVKLQTKYVQAF